MLTHNKMHKNNINRKDKKPHKKQTQKKYTQELWQNFIETVEFYSCLTGHIFIMEKNGTGLEEVQQRTFLSWISI